MSETERFAFVFTLMEHPTQFPQCLCTHKTFHLLSWSLPRTFTTSNSFSSTLTPLLTFRFILLRVGQDYISKPYMTAHLMKSLQITDLELYKHGSGQPLSCLTFTLSSASFPFAASCLPLALMPLQLFLNAQEHDVCFSCADDRECVNTCALLTAFHCHWLHA